MASINLPRNINAPESVRTPEIAQPSNAVEKVYAQVGKDIVKAGKAVENIFAQQHALRDDAWALRKQQEHFEASLSYVEENRFQADPITNVMPDGKTYQEGKKKWETDSYDSYKEEAPSKEAYAKFLQKDHSRLQAHVLKDISHFNSGRIKAINQEMTNKANSLGAMIRRNDPVATGTTDLELLDKGLMDLKQDALEYRKYVGDVGVGQLYSGALNSIAADFFEKANDDQDWGNMSAGLGLFTPKAQGDLINSLTDVLSKDLNGQKLSVELDEKTKMASIVATGGDGEKRQYDFNTGVLEPYDNTKGIKQPHEDVYTYLNHTQSNKYYGQLQAGLRAKRANYLGIAKERVKNVTSLLTTELRGDRLDVNTVDGRSAVQSVLETINKIPDDNARARDNLRVKLATASITNTLLAKFDDKKPKQISAYLKTKMLTDIDELSEKYGVDLDTDPMLGADLMNQVKVQMTAHAAKIHKQQVTDGGQFLAETDEVYVGKLSNFLDALTNPEVDEDAAEELGRDLQDEANTRYAKIGVTSNKRFKVPSGVAKSLLMPMLASVDLTLNPSMKQMMDTHRDIRKVRAGMGHYEFAHHANNIAKGGDLTAATFLRASMIEDPVLGAIAFQAIHENEAIKKDDKMEYANQKANRDSIATEVNSSDLVNNMVAGLLDNESFGDSALAAGGFRNLISEIAQRYARKGVGTEEAVAQATKDVLGDTVTYTSSAGSSDKFYAIRGEDWKQYKLTSGKLNNATERTQDPDFILQNADLNSSIPAIQEMTNFKVKGIKFNDDPFINEAHKGFTKELLTLKAFSQLTDVSWDAMEGRVQKIIRTYKGSLFPDGKDNSKQLAFILNNYMRFGTVNSQHKSLIEKITNYKFDSTTLNIPSMTHLSLSTKFRPEKGQFVPVIRDANRGEYHHFEKRYKPDEPPGTPPGDNALSINSEDLVDDRPIWNPFAEYIPERQ